MSTQCSTCSAKFTIEQDEIDFLQRISWQFDGVIFHPTTPTSCPDCRLKQRVCFRNESNLYKNTCCKTGKSIVSVYSKESPVQVMNAQDWHSDSFEALEYGRAYDANTSFFEQFKILLQTVPKLAIVTLANENCDYTTGTAYCKNCYLINSSEYAEDCSYGKLFQKCSDCMDCAYMYDSTWCYEGFDLHNCSNCIYVHQSHNSHECYFSSNLRNCKNCLLCSNVNQKQYCYKNEQLSKLEYEEKVKNALSSRASFEDAIQECITLRQSQIHKASNIVQSENCTGDFIENSKNCHECYDMSGSQDCKYITVGIDTKDCMDCSNMYIQPELVYHTLGTIEAYNSAYCIYIFYSQNMLYCDLCYNCSDCIGCTGLKRKKYCIFNKQYTKEEYEILAKQIIESMIESGEFGNLFPASMSPFSYNESLAQEYVPLTKEEIESQGFIWRDIVQESPKVEKTVSASSLPETINEVPDDIVNWAILCKKTNKPFKIHKKELEFYKTKHIPLPQLHPDMRYKERMRSRNPRILHTITCSKCDKKTKSTYADSSDMGIYCNDCYSKYMY